MFKNRFYKAALLAFLAIFSCSCNKYLALRPQDGITRDKFWQSKEQLQAAVIGIYNGLATGPAANVLTWGEIRADMVAPGSGISADETNIINTNILPTNAVTNWASFYSVIDRCNTVLDFGPGVKKIDNTLTDAQLNSSIAEALTIRSLMYFYLVRSFSDVPLKLKSTSSDADVGPLAKSSQAVILKQIVADLKRAEGLATITYGDTASDKGRVTIYTIYALEADVALWMDDYAACITACDNVINSNKFTLVPGDANWFNSLYVNGNSVEGIFEIQYTAQLLNPYFTFFSTTGKQKFLATPDIMDRFYTIDPLGDPLNVDIRGIDVAYHAADQSVYKYIALNPTTLRASATSYAHFIYYRYADILLMKAEACINSGRGQDALDLINVIRTRAHALPGSAETPDPADVNAMTDYLLNERAREFDFEGKRWYDLLRNAKRNNFARLDILTNAALSSVPGQYQQSAINKLKDPNSLYFPIYSNEITNDPLLIQNPFYK